MVPGLRSPDVTGQNERGSMTIWMMIMSTIILVLVGMSLDLFRAVAAERSLATAVDSAATAGANGIDEAYYRSTDTVQLDPGRAESLAADNLGVQPYADTLTDVTISATTQEVTVRATMPVALTLLRFIRPDGVQVSAESHARPLRAP